MSATYVSLMNQIVLPRAEKDVLRAMADHADENGEGVRASIPLIAWKSDYSVRQVQRIVGVLREKGVLVVTRQSGLTTPTEYRIELAHVPRKGPPPSSTRNGRPRKPGDISENPVTFPAAEPEKPGVTMSPGDKKPGDIFDTSAEPDDSFKDNTPPTPPTGGVCVGGVVGMEEQVVRKVVSPRPSKATREAEQVEAVLADWREHTHRSRTHKPDSRGWRKVRDRLRAGYTVEHLRLATRGAWADGFMRGTDRTRNSAGTDYTFPETIFRDDDCVERHIRTARSKLKPEPWWPAAEDAGSPFVDEVALPVQELRPDPYDDRYTARDLYLARAG